MLFVICAQAVGALTVTYTQEAGVIEIDYNSHPSLLSDTPELDGGILTGMHDGLGEVQSVVAIEHEPWYPWLMRRDHSDGLAEAVRDAAYGADVSGAAILATLWHESRLMHVGGDGRVKRGDGGRAIGIGQVHRDPWEAHFTKETGVEFDLDEMYDNVLACALILKRGGWEPGVRVCKQEAYSYYNTGRRGVVTGYGRRVHRTEQEIEREGGSSGQ